MSFAGKNALTANKQLLSIAQHRLASMDEQETVRQDTGWFMGVDGKMRFEVDDSDAKLRKKGMYGIKADININEAGFYISLKLSDIINHPKLFAAYPKIANIDVTLKSYGVDGKAQYNQVAHIKSIAIDKSIGLYEEIKVNDGPYPITQAEADKINAEQRAYGNIKILNPEKLLSSLLHEIQHDIQGIEGFETGGIPKIGDTSYAIKLAKRVNDSYRDRLSELRDADKWDEFEELDAKRRKEVDDIFLADKAGGDFPGFIEYRWSAGEVEARNTQRRREMTAEQRQLIPPSITQDVPDSDVILTLNGGVTLSQEKDIDLRVNSTLTKGMSSTQIAALGRLAQTQPEIEDKTRTLER